MNMDYRTKEKLNKLIEMSIKEQQLKIKQLTSNIQYCFNNDESCITHINKKDIEELKELGVVEIKINISKSKPS